MTGPDPAGPRTTFGPDVIPDPLWNLWAEQLGVEPRPVEQAEEQQPETGGAVDE